MSGKEHRQTTLGAIADFMNGGAWNQAEYSDAGVPVVRITDITEETVDLSDCKFLPKTSLARYRRHLLETGDLVICTVGSHPTQPGSVVGRAAVMPETAHGALLNQNAVRIRSALRDVDQGWLGYLGRSKQFHEYIISCARGSANQVRMAIGLLKEMPVEVPPLPIQKRIAGVLSAYDELIENSQRRIKILESMARGLYREWFVHFRFPGHENHPKVPSPLGDIPKGWEVKPLDSLKAEQPHAINGGPFGSKLVSKDYVSEGVPVIRGSNLSESGRFDPTGFVFVSNEKAHELRANLARPGDIVITQRGTLGQIGMIPPGLGHDSFVISQSQMKITLNHKKINREYAFFFLRSEESNQRIKNLAISSGVPHINLAILREFQILIPPSDLQTKFGKFAFDTETTIESLQRQIQNLRRTRDLLLPRLLSGQIDLKVD